jgi:hypothetical protein
LRYLFFHLFLKTHFSTFSIQHSPWSTGRTLCHLIFIFRWLDVFSIGMKKNELISFSPWGKKGVIYCCVIYGTPYISVETVHGGEWWVTLGGRMWG